MSLLVLEANQPLVQIGGQRQLSEQYYDGARQCEHVANTCAFYDFLLCGGEPYSIWR